MKQEMRRMMRSWSQSETVPQRELLGGTVPARTSQTGENLPTNLSRTNWKGNFGRNNAQSESCNEYARDKLESLQLSNSSFKNQQTDGNQSKIEKKSISRMKSLKNFWENPGKTELNKGSKPICERPMGGGQYRQINVTNQPQTGKEIMKSRDVTATKI